jgi:glutamyl/glutaminyl-tRNA synthetase
LLRDAAGVRLAKRNDALSIRQLRENGMTPEMVLEMAAVLDNTGASPGASAKKE